MKTHILFFAILSLVLFKGVPAHAATGVMDSPSARMSPYTAASSSVQERLEQIEGQLRTLELRLEEKEELWDRYLVVPDFTAARQVRKAQEELFARKELLERERQALVAEQSS